MERYTLPEGTSVGMDDYADVGTLVTFDGTHVIIGNREPRLGFKDSAGRIHVYLDDTCRNDIRLETTLDPAVLIGATITQVKGMREGSNEVIIKTDRGTLTMQHPTHCCEQVELLDVCGDPRDLIDGTISVFEVRSGFLNGKKFPRGIVWSKLSSKEKLAYRAYTFYEIRTTKGDVTLRWGEPDNSDDNRYGEEITLTLV